MQHLNSGFNKFKVDNSKNVKKLTNPLKYNYKI
jgi:hypothetical protein